MEVEKLEMEAELLTSARDREAHFAMELLMGARVDLTTLSNEVRSKSAALVADIPQLRSLIRQANDTNAELASGLDEYRRLLASKVCASTQTGDAQEGSWPELLATASSGALGPGMDFAALVETIVRIYLRQVSSAGAGPVWGRGRTDTIFDAILEYVHADGRPSAGAGVGVLPPAFDRDALTNPALLQILAGAAAHCSNTKIAMFCFLAGLSPAVDWGPPVWHFFTALLYNLKLMLAATWRTTITAWATPQGALLPAQVAVDALANLFNVASPEGLDQSLQLRLASLTQSRTVGGKQVGRPYKQPLALVCHKMRCIEVAWDGCGFDTLLCYTLHCRGQRMFGVPSSDHCLKTIAESFSLDRAGRHFLTDLRW